ncbi:MAG: DNA polymerase III subunit delta' C-terminal domain-containing protein [Clostridia bacterium]|nr:DNA polymerase III subunit delta' C-terminal domain-containing protein [Clostridia bacterium]
MKSFDEIIGHEKIKEHLQNAVKMNKISHAYIINGEQGSGKNMLADIFSKTLQCEQGGSVPCNECHSCLQADSKNHPDIIRITHEKPTSIGVEDVREQLVGDMQIRPYSSRYKIYIIDDADKMTIQAQNAILKTIEEPPEYGIIMLLTENADGLLQTILSRCVRLELNPVKDSLIQEHLIKKFAIPDYEARFAVAFARGCVGRAESIITSDTFVQMKDSAIHMLKYASEMTIGELVDSVKSVGDYKNNINDYLDLLAMWYRDVLLFKSTNDANLLIFKDELNIIRRQASVSSYEGIQNILTALDKAKRRLRANVNFELVMELLFLTMKEN